MSDAATSMDRMYRRQRHIYDASRKFYLLGRDEAIEGLNLRRGGSLLEIGCGTGRNLAKIARAYPEASLYGLDVSREMLATAAASLGRKGLSRRVRLAQGDAVQFDSEGLFERAQFEQVIFSFSLSMIPKWREAVAHALSVVAPGGALTIVDFGDCAKLPASFAAMLRRWLCSFDVTPRLEMPAVLRSLGEERGLAVSCVSLFRGYSLLARLSRSPL